MDRSKFGFYILTAFVFLFTIVILGINSSFSIDESNGDFFIYWIYLNWCLIIFF